MIAQPVLCRYEGEGEFKAVSPHRSREADKHYVIGEEYELAPVEQRSMGRHRAYFAQVREVWRNLPDEMLKRWPSETKLRKHALIRSGYCTSSSFICRSHAEALRFAAFLAPIDDYTIVEAEGTTVFRYVAESQSVRNMGKNRFNASVDAVLDWIPKLIGVDRAELERHAA